MDPARLRQARVRRARSEEDLARAEAFLQTPRVREIAEGHPEERGCVRLCEVDDQLIGALLLDPTPLRIRDVEVRCARIADTGGQDGRARFRETGDDELFVFLIEEFLGYLWARRYPIAYVHGELALYPSHGFVPCFYHPRVYVRTKSALELPADYRVRHLKSDDIDRILELRRAHRRWKPVVWASGVPLFRHFCIETPQREIVGCFSLEADAGSRWYPPFFAPEADVVDRTAAATLLRHCAEKAAAIGIEEMHFPLGPGHPVARLCLELGGRTALKGAASDPILDEELIHVVDPCRLVEGLAPHFLRRLAEAGAQEARGTVHVATGKGRWALSVGSGEVTLRPVEKMPSDGVEMPYWAFTQLLAGYRGPDEIDTRITPGALELLRLLLPKSWPYSMPDPDHWRDVAPSRPYTAAARAVVERTRLPWTGGV